MRPLYLVNLFRGIVFFLQLSISPALFTSTQYAPTRRKPTYLYSERGSFGDIMSRGLVTESSSSTSLAQKYGITDPLDRMALTANGNLQRLVASYYDSPVSVKVEECSLRESGIWDRKVCLSVYGRIFCTAASVIHVHDEDIEALVESEQVGLGQVFRFLDILPEFQLNDAGPLEGGGFWRNYTLSCRHLTCEIKEVFESNMWTLN